MKKTSPALSGGGSRRRFRDPFDLYLAGLSNLSPPLDREGEVTAAERLEAAEWACLERLIEAGVPLPELEQWATAFEEGRLDMSAIAQLGVYEGDEGRARLKRALRRAVTLERRYVGLLQGRTQKRGVERRTATERARKERTEAIRKIRLSRERVQELLERLGAELEKFSRADESPDELDSKEVIRRAQEVLGRRASVLRKLVPEYRRDRAALDRARNQLAEANLRLVVMLAKAYRASGVPFQIGRAHV